MNRWRSLSVWLVLVFGLSLPDLTVAAEEGLPRLRMVEDPPPPPEARREREEGRLEALEAPVGSIVGPDGRAYWAERREGSRGEVILRGDRQGENREIFAWGLCHSQGLAFDDFGNLFALDRDGGLGDGGRLLEVLQGSDFGWRDAYGRHAGKESSGEIDEYEVWMEENLWKPFFHGQTAAITPCLANLLPGVVAAGFAFQPGTALGEAYEGHFLVANSGEQRVLALRLLPDPDTAGFGLGETMLGQGVLTLPQGQALNGLGFLSDGTLSTLTEPILRMDVADELRHPMREETARWLEEEDLRRLPEGRLLALLGYPDQRVRLAAQFEIVRRGDFTILRQTAIADSRKIARIHGIWGCAQLVRLREGESLQGVAALAGHRDPEIRGEMIRALGETRSRFALDTVKDAMFDSRPRVRMRAALAMHHLAGPKDLKDIVAYVVANGGEDGFRRHGGVRALMGAARGWPELLVDLHEHESEAVRLAAVVALRRMWEAAVMHGEGGADAEEDLEGFSGLAEFLADESENVVVEAARSIHDVRRPLSGALSALAAGLDKVAIHREPLVRRMIHANRLLGDRAAAFRLLRFASTNGSGVPRELREEALTTAATWTRALTVDRVLGMKRTIPAASPELMHAAIAVFRERLLENHEDGMRDLMRETGYETSSSSESR